MLGNSSPFPLSVRNLDQRVGNARIKDFLNMRADRDYALERHDFNRSITADVTNTWTVANGGTATTWAALAAAGGWIRGITGTTTASAGLQMYQPTKYWTGTSGAGCAFLYKATVVEGLTIEMGFVDALPSINSTVVNNATTPTFNTSVDVAMFLYQHTSGNSTAAPDRVGLYTNNSSAATAQKSVQTIATLGAAPGPVAATEHFVAIELVGTTVMCWIGGQDEPLKLTSAITAANGVLPFFSVKGANSTSKNVDIDTIWTWSGRLG